MPRDEKLVDPKAKLDEQELETKRRAEEIVSILLIKASNF